MGYKDINIYKIIKTIKLILTSLYVYVYGENKCGVIPHYALSICHGSYTVCKYTYRSIRSYSPYNDYYSTALLCETMLYIPKQ